jgi:hypothetical protein
MRLILLVAAMVAYITIMPHVALAESPKPPLQRGYYWNVGDHESLTFRSDEERVQHLHAIGASEVHLFLNENRRTPLDCGTTFAYQEGGTRIWTAAAVERFTRALLAAQFHVVFTISPDIRTTGYLTSLSKSDGPLAVAKLTGVKKIELDTEANGEQAQPCPDGGLGRDNFDTGLVGAIRNTVGQDSQIIVSTSSLRYARLHPVLMNNAYALSPQLYEGHFGLSREHTRSKLASIGDEYPHLLLLPALSVECSQRDAQSKFCSREQFIQQLDVISGEEELRGSRLPEYVVWGERESKPCPSRPLCSTYGLKYLTDTATSR